MNWDNRVLPAAGGFRLQVRALLAQQAETWPELRDGIAALSEVRYRRLIVKGSDVLAQFNPRRIVSTTARVDSAAISERPCFLCPENLPAEEKGIAFGEDFLALCNPFPVLRDHLVISARRHVPQAIAGNFGALLDVAGELGREWFTLYNGPRSGASAPDHLHFQACSAEKLPILRDLDNWERRAIPANAGVDCFTLAGYRVHALIARSSERQALLDWFDRLLAQLNGPGEAEPMINLIATGELNSGWTVIVFPRSKHRPACYYAEGEARLTVSPAAIDLGGVVILPVAEHFARITAEELEKIFAEVTSEIIAK